MDFVTLIENIPPALYGVIIGAILTIIGVVLTNASNSKRLRLQHEHERELENKARDLNLRRDVYMDAMEAISAGLVAVSRFSELNVTSDELMHSYTDLSPKIGKVTIVGRNETIKAMATFNMELTGAFLRLSAKRENFHSLYQQAISVEQEMKQTKIKLNKISEILKQTHTSEQKTQNNDIDKQYEKAKIDLAEIKSTHDALWEQIMPIQMQLVKECSNEVARLDQLLVPLIGKMRSELELPFNETFYSEILKSGHKKQQQYLEDFFKEYDDLSAQENHVSPKFDL